MIRQHDELPFDHCLDLLAKSHLVAIRTFEEFSAPKSYRDNVSLVSVCLQYLHVFLIEVKLYFDFKRVENSQIPSEID